MLRGFRLGLGFSILYFISLDECLPQSFIFSLLNNSMGTTHKVSQQPPFECSNLQLHLSSMIQWEPPTKFQWELNGNHPESFPTTPWHVQIFNFISYFSLPPTCHPPPAPPALWFWERVEKQKCRPVMFRGKNIWNNWMNVIFFHLKNNKLLYNTIPNWSKTIIHKIPNIKPLN